MTKETTRYVSIQVVFWLLSISFAAGTFAVTQKFVIDKVEANERRIRKVEVDATRNSRIICALAIDLGASTASETCTQYNITK